MTQPSTALRRQPKPEHKVLNLHRAGGWERNVTASKAFTGEYAPVSGWWRPDADPVPFRYVPKGGIMPALEGNRTLWVLARELEPSARILGPLGPAAATHPNRAPQEDRA